MGCWVGGLSHTSCRDVKPRREHLPKKRDAGFVCRLGFTRVYRDLACLVTRGGQGSKDQVLTLLLGITTYNYEFT